jgi:hypothetical protein
MSPKKPILIMVLGRRWFQKTYGNTYNTASVIIQYPDGTTDGTELPMEYGYGSFYMQRAAQWCNEQGITPGNEGHAFLSLWCRENGVQLIDRVTDVQRKKDL